MFEMKRPWTTQQYLDGRDGVFTAMTFSADRLEDLEPDGEFDCKLVIGCGVRYYASAREKVFQPRRIAWSQLWVNSLKNPFTEVENLFSGGAKVDLSQEGALLKLACYRVIGDAKLTLEIETKLKALDRAAEEAVAKAAEERKKVRSSLKEISPWSRANFKDSYLDKEF